MKRLPALAGLLVIAASLAVPLAWADTVNFNDTFTVGSNTNLNVRTPDTGTSWTKVLSRDTAGDQLQISATADTLQSGNCGLNEGAGYTADATYSGADYYAQLTMVSGDSSDDYNWLGVRVEADGDGYWLRFNEDGAQMYEASGGAVTWATVGSAAGAIANGSVIRLRIEGSTITVTDDGSTIISTSDGTYTAAGKAGIGMGDLTNNGSDDCSSQELDNFSVTIIEAAAPSTGTGYAVLF